MELKYNAAFMTERYVQALDTAEKLMVGEGVTLESLPDYELYEKLHSLGYEWDVWGDEGWV